LHTFLGLLPVNMRVLVVNKWRSTFLTRPQICWNQLLNARLVQVQYNHLQQLGSTSNNQSKYDLWDFFLSIYLSLTWSSFFYSHVFLWLVIALFPQASKSTWKKTLSCLHSLTNIRSTYTWEKTLDFVSPFSQKYPVRAFCLSHMSRYAKKLDKIR
jgi:hypothetical protein